MQREIKQQQVISASASLHSGGVLSGIASNRIYSYLERETGLPMSELFPAGFVAASVNSIAAISFGLGYTADEYSEMFDRGAAAFSPPHIEKPSSVQIMRQLKGMIAQSISSGAFQRFCPQKLRDFAQNPLMDTAEFDAVIHEFINGYKLKDLDVSVIIGAGLVTNDIRHISHEFSRVTNNDGQVNFSDPRHADISLIDIIKASIAIPGILKGHYIKDLGQMFNDSGHVMDIAHSAATLHAAHDPALQPLHVSLGRVNHHIDASMAAAESYNSRHMIDHLLKGTYKTTTCAHTFNNQMRMLGHLYGTDNVIDLSIYVDPTTHPTDIMPVDDMLLNTNEQRRRIHALVDFEIARNHETYDRLVDRLGESAIAHRRYRETGSYGLPQPVVVPAAANGNGRGNWISQAVGGLMHLMARGNRHGQIEITPQLPA